MLIGDYGKAIHVDSLIDDLKVLKTSIIEKADSIKDVENEINYLENEIDLRLKSLKSLITLKIADKNIWEIDISFELSDLVIDDKKCGRDSTKNLFKSMSDLVVDDNDKIKTTETTNTSTTRNLFRNVLGTKTNISEDDVSEDSENFKSFNSKLSINCNLMVKPLKSINTNTKLFENGREILEGRDEKTPPTPKEVIVAYFGILDALDFWLQGRINCSLFEIIQNYERILSIRDLFLSFDKVDKSIVKVEVDID